MSFLITAWVLAVWATAARAHVRFWNVPGECNVKGVPCSAVPGLTLSTEYKPCLSHPEAAYGAHLEPINDTDAEFYGFYDGQRLMDPAEPLCPGKQYGAWIRFPTPVGKGREALLTTERGQLYAYMSSCDAIPWWSSELYVLDQECRGSHASWGQYTRSGVIAFNLTIPCPAAKPRMYTQNSSARVPYDGIDDPAVVAGPAVEEFKMRLTSSGGAGDHFRQITWTLKVAAICGAQKCTNSPPIEEPPCTDPGLIDDEWRMESNACRRDSNYACPEGSEKSDQGYMCMMRVANWKLHFSADFLSPGPCRPVNPCTDFTANGLIRDTTNMMFHDRPGIHLMMEGPQQGYMSLAFATTSQMNNSDAVIGWYNPNTDMNYIYALPLGHHTSPFLFNKYQGDEYFAYAGMYINNITNTQLFCFSRQETVYLSRNVTFPNGVLGSIPNVQSLNFNDLMLLWAVHDTADDIVAHTPDNMGFVILQDLFANVSSRRIPGNTIVAIAHAMDRMHNSLYVAVLMGSCLIALFGLGQL